MPFLATWMEPESIILSEVSQKERTNILYHSYGESKIWHKWTYLWKRNRLTDIENRLVVAKGKGVWGRDGVVVWGEQVQTIIYRMDKQQSPTL